ncbi:MAG: putative nucleotidyltransferase substrate binding domain-containing protein [Solirubrobacteraceae bacterium]
MRGHDQAGRAGGGGGADGLNARPGAEPDPMVTRFLGAHPPFDALAPDVVDQVAAAAELETLPAGTTIFSQGDEPPPYLRVIRSGAVEIVSDGRVLDLLGEGELFGQASMLSGFPTGFEARAAEDTVCYRIAADVAQGLLSRPEGLRFVARSLLAPPTELHVLARQPARNLADQPVSALVRGEPVVCEPEATIRSVAARMADAGESSAVVALGEGRLGILTDRDLRTRVVAAGLPVDCPVSEAMSAPVYTCAPDRPAGEVLLEMLDRGFRHFPVVSARGSVLGVVADMDLVAARTQSSFYLRERISKARSASELAVVAGELAPMVMALHDAHVEAANVMGVYAVVVDTLTRRLLELELARHGDPGVEFAWLALGSQARREALPSSDIDSAVVWFDSESENGKGAGDAIRERLLAITRDVASGLMKGGLRIDEHGANASDVPFVRSLSSWQGAARTWLAEPTREKAVLLASVLVDSRPVWGVHRGTPVADTFELAPASPALLRLMGRFALSHRPPTGFFRGLVVEHSGAHRGRLDLKTGGVLPIVDLARWGAMAAGVTSASTPERLRAAGAAGTLSPSDAHTLLDAFELINNLRLEHQVGQLRAGRPPDDHVDPVELSTLMRTHLKDAFRAVTSIQKRIGSELDVGVR